ncbi:MAG: 5-methylcytosine-specific restriction endonuclease system specificity protein McrC [Schwartzia sp.]|nr:5-methylcytosine-specific restriction endonuclease system specificity protein McrC [Schwartzia sp. (in: firmicutes)]
MIPVRNIYYMLSYAFRALRENGYKRVETESFENTAELFAAILISGITLQVKRGLGREYIEATESLSSPKGKLAIAESLKRQTHLKKQLVCTYDDFSVNARLNQILKSSALLLLRSGISKPRRKSLRRLLAYFGDVDEIDLRTVDWNFRYHRNNKSYQMLMAICFLLYQGLLQTQSDSRTKLMDFLDDQHLSRLYEKFLLAYYRREFPQLSARAAQIPWQLDGDRDALLPVMQTDVTLSHRDKTLIIDAKYYSRALQSQYDKNTLRSGHLYQIFTYVKNAAAMKGQTHEVSGMLLYAKTDESLAPDQTYSMTGNTIRVETLDLNQDFSKIAAQLNRIVEEHFNLRRT